MTTGRSQDLPQELEMESAVIIWLRDSLEDPEITGSDNFLDVGGHSLTFAELNEFARERFGLSLDIQIMYEKTISDACGVAATA